MQLLKTRHPKSAILFLLGLLTMGFQSGNAAAAVLVLECKGTAHCETCATDQKQVGFDWTYTVDLSSGRVDGKPANVTEQLISWKFKSNTVLDEREISRYSKRFHYAGKSLISGEEIYFGDGVCEPQGSKAF